MNNRKLEEYLRPAKSSQFCLKPSQKKDKVIYTYSPRKPLCRDPQKQIPKGFQALPGKKIGRCFSETMAWLNGEQKTNHEFRRIYLNNPLIEELETQFKFQPRESEKLKEFHLLNPSILSTKFNAELKGSNIFSILPKVSIFKTSKTILKENEKLQKAMSGKPFAWYLMGNGAHVIGVDPKKNAFYDILNKNPEQKFSSRSDFKRGLKNWLQESNANAEYNQLQFYWLSPQKDSQPK